MYAPHVITVYNLGEEDILTGIRDTNITILTGVLLDASKAVNVNESGLVGADAVNLYIPFSVSATDGETGGTKAYLPYNRYRILDDVSGYWTLTTDETCFFVKGEVVEKGADFSSINRQYDDVYRVTKIDTKDFGTEDMQHWEVGGA